ncbi:MAG: GH92 family glycosyl hydrolase [Prevotella sp.]|nr:GH92 family glycosyl hydrolase [Prevotella sp.]MCI1686134.1 GH92 family glycosyl hydrolase [Prevotella sp.]MCI1781573.1 GH92 family glycosyl hydrolase [Prevotella sp.]MCI1802153.1 GH92 family glycosyl hydrolase [Prevotella sp.]MCI1817356.1 GH92 family glycosyl hydrolase [Prevotella sp.]
MAVTLSAQNYTQYVDPYIGTGGHGHVFLGANVPFGLVQVGPTEHTRGWDWCSGYHYSDSILIGFGEMHLSGTGIGDLGDVSLLPVLDIHTRSVPFSHKAERVRPGYYSLMLPTGIRVELTASKRVGFHRYSFPADVREGHIVLNLKQGIGWDKMVSCGFRQVSNTVITGFRNSEGWAKDRKVYFAALFSRPVILSRQEGDSIGILSFSNSNSPILVKVGISAVSEENARENIEAEIPDWDFNSTVEAADKTWNEELSKIAIKTNDRRARCIFYTSLYHTMIAPSVFCDVNGDYRGADGKIHQGDFTNYTTFSLWDTYRAAHPLSTLIHPDMQKDIAQTFLHIFQQQGKLPIWHLMGNETNCMVGNPGIPVLIDIALKGYDVDKKAILNAAIKSSMLDERGMELLKKYGYIPCDLDPTYETVSKGLEYAISDACVAKLAKQLGDTRNYKYFYNRSQSYRKYYFDKKTGFMRGVTSGGQFREPFNPFHSVHQHDDYTEGNAWQYTWLVPEDVHGLVHAFGGEKKFVSKLDSLFIVRGSLGANASPDISGLIGEYAQGNEPSHHIVYMYNYVGQPWKAAPKLRQIMSTLYRDSIDGLCGNEDVGQMSAWYVLSSLGLYQVEPSGGKYIFGSPIFDKAVLKVGKNKIFNIVTRNNSNRNIYIQSVKLNGRSYTKSYINFRDIVRGGTLEFIMGDKPSLFGTKVTDRP